MTSSIKVNIRQLAESDLPAADHMVRLAFGTFLGLPDPMTFFGDSDNVKTRFLADPTSTLAAESTNGQLVGFNFVTNWGSVGYFGPLVVHPDYWDQGVAKQLLEPTMNIFDKKWHTRHAGLFTFAHSAKHVGLYQKFGFWPRFLTMIMSKPIWPVEEELEQQQQRKRNNSNTTSSFYWSKFSEIPKHKQELTLDKCRLLTNSVYDGLDVKHEIVAVNNQNLGDTILLYRKNKYDRPTKDDDNNLAGFAICHCGAGSEAGSGVCYIKFGIVKSDNNSEENFGTLLNVTSVLAKDRHLSRIVAGVNTERSEAYRYMVTSGFRADMQGISMHRPNEPGYNHSGVYLIDDWR
jgi:ribosomal protein S18 acetylase RimI-like enzyme